MLSIETSNIDLEIKNIDKVIFENIERDINFDRGFMSQNILTRLRNLIEHTALKIFSNVEGYELAINYENIAKSVRYVKKTTRYKFLGKFHTFTQNSVGHRTPTNENAERLMLKYYEYLLLLKKFYQTECEFVILNNINKFPLNTDESYYKYYGEIASKIDSVNFRKERTFVSGRYYIQKRKPFFINNNIYYEITLSPENENLNKTERITIYTKCNIDTNYAIKISLLRVKAKIFDCYTDINIVDTWQISIRPCEIKNFYKIFGKEIEMLTSYGEYKEVMNYLTQFNVNLLDLVTADNIEYTKIKTYFNNRTKTCYIFDLLDKCRRIVNYNMPGCNIIRYLLYKCNNRIIKSQYNNESNKLMSNLYFKWESIPFDRMPFVFSPHNHNPKGYDLIECIEAIDRKDELMARYIIINAEQNGCIYTSKDELMYFGNVDELIKVYNSKLYKKHKYMEIKLENDVVYINEYQESTVKIINILKEFSKDGIIGYKQGVEYWLSNTNIEIDDNNKKEILKMMFEKTKVSMIYGAAGTGKTTMINYISNYYDKENKLYLANTHPAVENLKRKVSASNSTFYTIKKILYNDYIQKECDLLIIDECSTVSNRDMLKILSTIKFKLLILVGDIYQIESITFGNWFNISKIIFSENVIHELQVPYRSNNDNLKELWTKVRNLDDDIIECIVRNRYSKKIDSSILDSYNDGEIILCLNYDGLYGINNINRFMQNSNKSMAYEWGINTFKVGDPILFNETNRFLPIIYNNLKGKIVKIDREEHRIWFDIEIDGVIDGIVAENAGLELLSTSESKSVIRFFVNQYKDLDDDIDDSENIVPFNVAYAVSIHKCQGLEYKSVKIIITQEIEERISHNIFYTAITRARENLKIYWTPECENNVIKNLKCRFNAKDASIIRNKITKY